MYDFLTYHFKARSLTKFHIQLCFPRGNFLQGGVGKGRGYPYLPSNISYEQLENTIVLPCKLLDLQNYSKSYIKVYTRL